YGRPVKPEDVPLIQGPALGTYTEISRGCGRGCKFCAPNTSGKMRDLPLEKIVHDAKINAEGSGNNSMCLQSEDVFLYGSNSKYFYPDEDAIMNLYKTLFEDVGINRVFVTHSTLAPMAFDPDLFERLTKYLRSKGHRFYGCQPGIETGCTKTIGEIMHGKALPFSSEEYPDMIYDALRTCANLGWMNACTLVAGLPSEGPDEIKETLELIKRLDGFPHLYIPLFFVPMKVTSMRDSRAFIADYMTLNHKRLVLECWKHNIKYIDRNYSLVANESGHNYMIKAGIRVMIEFLRAFIRYHERRYKKDEIELIQ
ncbi:MAG: radical SAM protein, partial [Promethearchaeota archaeon]